MRLVPNVAGVASAPEGTVISFSCYDSNQALVGEVYEYQMSMEPCAEVCILLLILIIPLRKYIVG